MAIVTGGNSGIGRAIVLALAKAGAAVTINYQRNQNAAEDVKRQIAQGGGGRIINISSVHEDWPMPGNTPYCCAKGGVRMLTRTAAVELAPHGITDVGVGPGAVATPINQSTLDDPEKKAALVRAIPVGHIAQPEEIANLVAWLAPDKSAYVTATTYFIDGGIMQSSVGL